MKLKSLLFSALAAVILVGCEANGVDPLGGDGGNTAPPGSIGDTDNCQVVIASLCVIAGESHDGGLVDVLLADDGPLGPISSAINVDALIAALRNTLTNEEGDLAGLLQGLFAEGQLQEGLTLLLLGADGDGMGALAETLTGLLLPNDEGTGLMAIIGADGGGAVGLLQALLMNGSDTSCQAPLGTLCLINGDGNQTGLLDLLLTSEGLLGGLTPTLTEEATDELVATLGNLLSSNGALTDLVGGLFQEGQLVAGLQALLMGSPDDGVPSGLLNLLEGSVGNLGEVLGEVLDNLLGGLLGGGLPLPLP